MAVTSDNTLVETTTSRIAVMGTLQLLYVGIPTKVSVCTRPPCFRQLHHVLVLHACY
ncbi:unnamed protein product [Fusarium graminearum]|uniref:Chromosome 3, complete genome n=1 Tax=Gibberella zeae (strain ATCC MYA-4620 / CBS 123657 / FGSC 9075 / NRRL 31084 / PH-1) TaxID=229533 RepID=A0A098E501_GIBZE|nr:unnamed protein product [Fusarium graminearum]CZS84141.1 unnamed protein product [Fusarium graminearum]